MLPPPIADYLEQRAFWAGGADFDLWYGTRIEELYWIHVRRKEGRTLALHLFDVDDEGEAELELYDLTRAPVHGLRATLVSPALMTLERFEPALPVVAIRLADGRSHALTLPRVATTLPDLWLSDALARLRAALAPQWRLAAGSAALPRETVHALWPEWAGEGVMG